MFIKFVIPDNKNIFLFMIYNIFLILKFLNLKEFRID